MEKCLLFAQILAYIYVVVAFVLVIMTVCKLNKFDDDKDMTFPFTILASILWPIAFLMFLMVRIDQKRWKNYNNGENEHTDKGKNEHE